MANLTTSADILNDILFRMGEKTDGTSDFDAKALDFLNRAYRELAQGGSAFSPEVNVDWWWLNQEIALLLEPAYETGTISVTKDSTSATLSDASTSGLTGWWLKVDGWAEPAQVSAHTGGSAAITLDKGYTGDTDSAAAYRIFKSDYSLAGPSPAILSPMRLYGTTEGEGDIDYMDPPTFHQQYPLEEIRGGTPTKFTMLAHTTGSQWEARFNAYPSGDNKMRIDYFYKSRPADLADDTSEPLVPLEWRHILSDMALTYLLEMTNSSRALGVREMATNGLKAMKLAHRSMTSKVGDSGRIYTRPRSKRRRLLRTESGNIIG